MAFARDSLPRYSVRTLVLLTMAGPPLLALAWFGAIWAWYAAPDMHLLAQHCWFPGMYATLALVVVSLAYYPRTSTERIRLNPRRTILLWCFQFLVLSHWMWIIYVLCGWLFVWGDNDSPLMDLALPLALIVAATMASITSVRNTSGLATLDYVKVVVCLTTVLAILAAPYWLHRLPRMLGF